MPPVHSSAAVECAFTVIHHEDARPSPAPPPRNVNVVKPLQRDAEPELAAPPAAAPSTILDPKFSRALDFKLRRLKEKEVLRANLRRPTAHRPHRAALAASDRDMGEPRPRFVTTVKAGRFLLPPPEVACLLGLEALYPPRERERLVYSFASEPKAVAARAERALPTKERGGARSGAALGGVRALAAGTVRVALDGSAATAQYSNVMHDKRVVRGSTFAAHPHAAGDGAESAAARAGRSRRRALARRAAAARPPASPPAAPGRRHLPLQTEYYLEELFEKGAELEVGVQTDAFADRPATPAHAPAKTGADAHTQIHPGDLFDFEAEVQPVLEALVARTAEQALAEVAQEEELGALREQQRRYAELRDAERAERQRLAAQHARLLAEKERRVAEGRAARRAALGARDRAAAAALVRGYVAELLPAVLAGLRRQGYLAERLQRGADEEFMPWLTSEVSQEIESIITSRDVISEIVRDVVEARAAQLGAADERGAELRSPPDSITPPSEPAADDEESPHALED